MDSLPPGSPLEEPDFKFRAGCTVLVDLRTAEIRRIIRTNGTIADRDALERVRKFMVGEFETAGNAFDAGLAGSLRLAGKARNEPFALLHRMEEG